MRPFLAVLLVVLASGCSIPVRKPASAKSAAVGDTAKASRARTLYANTDSRPETPEVRGSIPIGDLPPAEAYRRVYRWASSVPLMENVEHSELSRRVSLRVRYTGESIFAFAQVIGGNVEFSCSTYPAGLGPYPTEPSSFCRAMGFYIRRTLAVE